jgi:hypothetical protein
LLPQRFVYRQMMYWVLFRAVMRAVQGGAVGWTGPSGAARRPIETQRVEPQVPTPAGHV